MRRQSGKPGGTPPAVPQTGTYCSGNSCVTRHWHRRVTIPNAGNLVWARIRSRSFLICKGGAALGAPYILLVLAVVGTSIFHGGNTTLAGLGESREFPQFSALGFLAYNIISFGFGEEVGWRGFALPRLQTRHSALIASLLLTAGWALWHAPLFLYRTGYTSMDAAGVAGWLFSLLTGAILLTWLYNESRGSILVVAIFHATVDVVFTSSIASSSVVSITGVLVTLWGIIVLVVVGPRYLSKRGKVVRDQAAHSWIDELIVDRK